MKFGRWEAAMPSPAVQGKEGLEDNGTPSLRHLHFFLSHLVPRSTVLLPHLSPSYY